MRRYEGKVALITGAAQGIGAAVARRIVAEGGSVLVTDLLEDKLEELADELNSPTGVTAGGGGAASGGAAGAGADVGGAAGGGVVAVGRRVDVTDRVEVDGAVAGAVERFGRLDLVVNNAGGGIVHTNPEDTTDDQWRAQLDVTLLGASRFIQAALPELLKTRGNVVTICSVNALAAFGNVEYSAAKAGQIALTRNYAARYGEHGVRFNAVAPGTIRTAFWDSRPEQLAAFTRMYPLGRVGEPEDVAAAVAFLGSSDAAWITGHTLPVEGGVLTGPGLIRPRSSAST